MFITIVGAQQYLGMDVFHISQKLELRKDKENNADTEAIKAVSDSGTTYGYVSNSVGTRAKGCNSAGFIYDTFVDSVSCIVRFIVDGKVIAEVLYPADKTVNKAMKK